MRREHLAVLCSGWLLLACDRSPAAVSAPPDGAGRAACVKTSAPTRWVEVRAPADATLLTAPARVVAGAQAQGEVSAPYAARVVSVRVSAGQRVKKGDAIVEVVMPEVVEAAGQYIASGAQLAVHAARAAELAELQKERLVERARVFEQKARVAELEAEQAKATAVLRSAGVSRGRIPAVFERGIIALTAPVDGVVSGISAKPGEVRQSGSGPLATIVGQGDARVEARLAEPPPSDARLSFQLAGGRVFELAREPESMVVDPVDGTQILFLRLRQTTALQDGLRGTLHVAIDEPGVLQIPARALRSGAQGPEVLRRGPEGQPNPVAVKVLVSSGATALVAGLQPGDFVADNAGAWPADEGAEAQAGP